MGSVCEQGWYSPGWNLRCAMFEPQVNATLRMQCDQGLRLDYRVTWQRDEAVMANDRRQDQGQLGQGEVLSYANPAAAAEWYVDVFRASIYLFGREPLRPEGLRFVPEVRMPVQEIAVDQHIGFGGYPVAAHYVILASAPHELIGRRINPEDLVYD